MNDIMKQGREFLSDRERLRFDFSTTDQNRGISMPPLEPPDEAGIAVTLPDPYRPSVDFYDLVTRRESLRRYKKVPVSLEALSTVLFLCQGVRKNTGTHVLRTVPSAGNRHALDLYVVARDVCGLEPGIYCYLPLRHGLMPVGPLPGENELTKAALGQRFVEDASFTLIFAATPYRMEWRYGPTAHRVILMDVGHAMQNAILAGEALGLGACPVAAYDQEAMDDLLGLDGDDSLVIYLAAFGPRP